MPCSETVEKETVPPGAACAVSVCRFEKRRLPHYITAEETDEMDFNIKHRFPSGIPAGAEEQSMKDGKEHGNIPTSAHRTERKTGGPINVLELANRRECFFDDFLTDAGSTTAKTVLHHPQFRETVLVHDAPWEGDGCDYHNFFFDPSWPGVDGTHPEGVYRMYYLGWQMISADGTQHKTDGIRVCYAESTDGIAWTKPKLGICSFQDSTDNNIIMDSSSVSHVNQSGSFDNFMVFRDENPACSPDRRYKAVGSFGCGLWCFFSADGIRFSTGYKLAVEGFFDSLNVVFRDPLANRYRGFIRGFHNARIPGKDKVRDIRYVESEDFLSWTPAEELRYNDAEDIPLYTNCISPYFRAPHIFVGFPSRYIERKVWDDSFEELCGKEKRLARMKIHPRYGLAVTDCVFMTSRDGLHFHRFGSAFMRPEIENGRNWVYGDCYPARGFAVTKPPFPGAPDELSMYVFTNHWMGIPATLDRYAIRMDGFASLHADAGEETVLTKFFTFDGKDLFVNFETSAMGYIRFTLCDSEGNEYTSCEHFGNSPDRRIRFGDGVIASLAGRPVRLRIRMKDADLYSIQFR